MHYFLITFSTILLSYRSDRISSVHALIPLAPPRVSSARRRMISRCRLSRSQVTDWVVENLEASGSNITSSSSTKAGENDTLPPSGLLIGRVRVLAADSTSSSHDAGESEATIRLLVGRNGWGTGVHPTTRLCLEWVCKVVQGGETFLDYGCGSGILSIAAMHLGANRCVGVDIEAEALVSAERNLILNGYTEERFELLHTREVIPFDNTIAAGGVDLCVANILIGQLVRPSMVAALATNVAAGGLLCLSGIRPDQVPSLRLAYDDYFDWLEDQYSELSASETEGSLESYGFDCGRWARVVGRKRSGTLNFDSLSELAVS